MEATVPCMYHAGPWNAYREGKDRNIRILLMRNDYNSIETYTNLRLCTVMFIFEQSSAVETYHRLIV